MNIKNVTRWVKALESGKYEQKRRCLFNGKRYCCLGVVCDLAGLKPRKIMEDGNTFFKFEKSENYLPRIAQQWLGVSTNDPKIGGISATVLNDDKKYSFKQIAKEIRKHWLKQ